MNTVRRLAEKAPPIGIRLPVESRLWLEMFSSENCRSMNSVVIEALRRYRAQVERPTQQGVSQ